MKKDLLIVFLRAPERGRVKTRLAATLGDDRALAIYRELLDHTLHVSAPVRCTKQAWYADGIPDIDIAADHGFAARIQQGKDLGERMAHAIANGFDDGYDRVMIIGTDCPGISTTVLEEAFAALDQQDAVIGPARDGGYYLLGMRRMIPDVFHDKVWSSDTVLRSTIADLDRLDATYSLLPELIDVDTEADLAAIGRSN